MKQDNSAQARQFLEILTSGEGDYGVSAGVAI